MKSEVKSIDIVIGDISDEMKQITLHKIPSDPTKTMGLPSVVKLAVSLIYYMSTNVSVPDGITNGVECRIAFIDYRVAGSTRPSIIWVSLFDQQIGIECRKENAYLYSGNSGPKWTPILEMTRHFNISNKSQVQIIRRQFPLRQSAAKTIHRSQADTVDELVVDFPKSSREHMHYVALSRVTKLENLQIRNLNKDKIAASNKVKCKMKHSREESKLIPCIQQIYNNKAHLTVVFQNVRSLHLHVKDIAADFNLQASDVISLGGTALMQNDINEIYYLKYFDLYRSDYHPVTNPMTPYGLAIYVRKGLLCEVYPFNLYNVEVLIAKVIRNKQIIDIVTIYRSKLRASVAQLIQALDELHHAILKHPSSPVIILGDFNVNLTEPSSEQKLYGKEQMIHPNN